jgi:beta-lactamase class A
VWIRLLLILLLTGCSTVINYDTPVDRKLQVEVEKIDASLRTSFGMPKDAVDVGVLDLQSMRLALIHPDKIEYAASVAKVGILLAWFHLHPEGPDAGTKHELGLMAKASNNEMATKFSREIGIAQVQQIIESYGFYDKTRGGGIWFGKHYGPNSERFGDPLADHSHAATVRQLIRFWYLLDQDKLVSPAASKTMKEIFASPDIPHDNLKFVKGLDGRDVTILRKWGTWQDWLHDTALVTGPGRRYIIVGLTHHPRGDEYLEGFAREVDDLLTSHGRSGGSPAR